MNAGAPQLGRVAPSRPAAQPLGATPTGLPASSAPWIAAVGEFLLARPALLLPLASSLDDRAAVFETSIRGPSMHPAIAGGARLRVRLLGSEPCRKGDIVFFLAGGGYMVHRVVYRGRRLLGDGYLLTCGDNQFTPDSPLRDDQVLGLVIAVQTDNGWRDTEPVVCTPWRRRALRAATRMVMIATLCCSATLAQRMAGRLERAEQRARSLVRFVRGWRRSANPQRAGRD